MRSLKFYKTLAIVLLIVNIGTVTFFFLSGPPHPPRPGEILLSKEIGLTGKAKREVDALEKKHYQTKKKLLQRDLKLHSKLYGSMSDEAKSDKLLQEIKDNKIEIEEMTFDFFKEVASYCNPTQREKLDQMIQRSLRMILHLPPPRPGQKHKKP